MPACLRVGPYRCSGGPAVRPHRRYDRTGGTTAPAVRPHRERPLLRVARPHRIFLFYQGDREEAPHTHVERDNNIAKFWLEPSHQDRAY